jgi:hypothetical protein
MCVHFTINRIELAEASVDARFGREMADGAAALASKDAREIINANAGGPYGSEGGVLRQVQADSDAVRKRVVAGEVGAGWAHAELAITADETEPWTVASGNETFTFAEKDWTTKYLYDEAGKPTLRG